MLLDDELPPTAPQPERERGEQGRLRADAAERRGHIDEKARNGHGQREAADDGLVLCMQDERVARTLACQHLADAAEDGVLVLLDENARMGQSFSRE